MVARFRKERLGSLTPIEALITELQDNTWASHYTTDETGRVNFLFFAPYEAIDLAQSSPDVLFIDATYRTNRYNMPLIHFLTITPIGKTVSVAMCFVAAETEPMYLLAVTKFRELVLGNLQIEVIFTDTDVSLKGALTTVFPSVPQLLCIWHINKNVETAVADHWKVNTLNQNNEENKEKRKSFLERWNTVISQPTEEEFEDYYKLFKRFYADQPELVNYIEKNKYPVRHQFATAFTSKFRHLGHSATSRGENGHRMFKRYLLSSRHDLLELKDRWLKPEYASSFSQ